MCDSINVFIYLTAVAARVVAWSIGVLMKRILMCGLLCANGLLFGMNEERQDLDFSGMTRRTLGKGSLFEENPISVVDLLVKEGGRKLAVHTPGSRHFKVFLDEGYVEIVKYSETKEYDAIYRVAQPSEATKAYNIVEENMPDLLALFQ